MGDLYEQTFKKVKKKKADKCIKTFHHRANGNNLSAFSWLIKNHYAHHYTDRHICILSLFAV